jgi:hypothetical protein
MRKLISWCGDRGGVTVGKVYNYDMSAYTFLDDNGYSRECHYGSWLDVVPSTTSNTTEEHTGGSSSYYGVLVAYPIAKDKEPYVAECIDIQEALEMTPAEANGFKAIWRTAAARMGKKKKGNTAVYDAEKVIFQGERMLVKAKREAGL